MPGTWTQAWNVAREWWGPNWTVCLLLSKLKTRSPFFSLFSPCSHATSHASHSLFIHNVTSSSLSATILHLDHWHLHLLVISSLFPLPRLASSFFKLSSTRQPDYSIRTLHKSSFSQQTKQKNPLSTTLYWEHPGPTGWLATGVSTT